MKPILFSAALFCMALLGAAAHGAEPTQAQINKYCAQSFQPNLNGSPCRLDRWDGCDTTKNPVVCKYADFSCVSRAKMKKEYYFYFCADVVRCRGSFRYVRTLACN